MQLDAIGPAAVRLIFMLVDMQEFIFDHDFYATTPEEIEVCVAFDIYPQNRKGGNIFHLTKEEFVENYECLEMTELDRERVSRGHLIPAHPLDTHRIKII